MSLVITTISSTVTSTSDIGQVRRLHRRTSPRATYRFRFMLGFDGSRTGSRSIQRMPSVAGLHWSRCSKRCDFRHTAGNVLPSIRSCWLARSRRIRSPGGDLIRAALLGPVTKSAIGRSSTVRSGSCVWLRNTVGIAAMSYRTSCKWSFVRATTRQCKCPIPITACIAEICAIAASDIAVRSWDPCGISSVQKAKTSLTDGRSWEDQHEGRVKSC